MLTAAAFAMLSTDAASVAPANTTVPIDPMVASSWEIGPIIQGQNYSVKMPLRPTAIPGGGWYFDIPSPSAAAGHVHYVTFNHGSLTGKTRIVLRYRLEMAEGVQIVPAKEQPGTFPSILTLYFQRRNDNWSGTGTFEAYRWWATSASVMPLTAGEHEISVPLDAGWTAVGSSSASTNPKGFRDAVRDAERVGFTFGGGDGYGHGVYATGRARFVVTSFQVLGDTDFGAHEAPGD
jgi:hypothetical protein